MMSISSSIVAASIPHDMFFSWIATLMSNHLDSCRVERLDGSCELLLLLGSSCRRGAATAAAMDDVVSDDGSGDADMSHNDEDDDALWWMLLELIIVMPHGVAGDRGGGNRF